MNPVRRVFFLLLFLIASSAAAPRAQLPKEVGDKIDALIASAYQAAAIKMPCKIGFASRSRMLSWQNVDKCLSGAVARVNWEELSKQLDSLRPPTVSEGDFASAVEASLTKHALPYDKVFRVKNDSALLPLTNSILKYLPGNSIADQPVLDRKAKRVGTFATVFFYERAGGLSTANSYRLALFQYTDLEGKLQTPADRLLLDTFGVPWNKVSTLPGFRLASGKLPNIAIR